MAIAQRDQFQNRVDDLVKKVRGWVESHAWVTKEYPKKMRDIDDQIYELKALFLQKGPTRPRVSADRMIVQVHADPNILKTTDASRGYLGDTDMNLKGTYLVRLFAAFEGALR